jgi:hypothetical protein
MQQTRDHPAGSKRAWKAPATALFFGMPAEY